MYPAGNNWLRYVLMALGALAGLVLLVAVAGILGSIQLPPPATPTPIAVATPTDPNFVIKVELNGDIWMPSIKSPNAPFVQQFVAPFSGQFTWSGINAELRDERNVRVVGGANGVVVPLRGGTIYTVIGGEGNGGFALRPVR